MDRFRQSALESDGSLFSPSASIWTTATITDLHQRYNLQPDTSNASFEVKLRRHLDGAPDATLQLAAEAIFVHQLIVDDIGAKAKRRLVGTVLSWMTSPCTIPPDLDAALDHGLVSGGLAFKTLRPFQLHFMVEFAKAWKALAADYRMAALHDPWRFKQFLWQVPIQSGSAQREALLHLLFPDTFEDIIAREHKARIADGFARELTQAAEDVDQRLADIRKNLTPRFGEGFSFYDPEVRPLWDSVAPDPALWDGFFKWAKKMRVLPNFSKDERQYKLLLVGEFKPVMDAVAAGEAWLESMTNAIRSKYNNITRWQANQPFLEWCGQHPEEALRALRAAWKQDASVAERLKTFQDALPEDLLSGSDLLRMMSLLLLAANPGEWPPVTAGSLAKACKLTGYPQPSPGSDEGQRYRHALSFFDRMIAEGPKRGVNLPDRLEAQGTMWATLEWGAPDPWSESERAELLAWRDDTAPPAVHVHEVPVPAVPAGEPSVLPKAPARSLQQLADELFMPLDFLEDLVSLLRSRKQIIIYGPPGTGKTYVARKLAEHLAPEPSKRSLVQFHPSYSYEDFVEGYRPVEAGGNLAYELRSGPLLELARTASASPDDHVLVIDEINRGNLPRILGELLFALEYRDEPVKLMYGRDSLRLPRNLLVIGTMNTADRSIGLIDAAMRRRFHFVRLFPGEGPLAGLLRSWLDKNNPDMIEVADIVDKLNSRLRETVGPHLQVGYSHFLREDLSQEILAQVWENDIIPFLEDQFFGREAELKAFSLERLREETVAAYLAPGTAAEHANPAQQG